MPVGGTLRGMTEAEWLNSSVPLAMLAHLFGPMDEAGQEIYFSRRKLLLDVACFARLKGSLPLYARLWHVHAEQAADGRYPTELLGAEGEDADVELGWATRRATETDAGRLSALAETWAGVYSASTRPAFYDERNAQAALVRDIYGNPFRPVINLDAACTGKDAVAVAHAIYEANAFECMDRLVEELESAGCTNKDVIDHCRQRGPHVRGCWVIDLLLGKA
jgi:hypothetical protein